MIQFTVQQVNELLQALGNVPYCYSAPLIAGIKQIAEAQVKTVQTQGAANPTVQADINQAEANSDSMANE